MTLGKLRRNKIYRVIEGGNLDLSEFQLTETGDRVTVTHNSGSRFVFEPRMSRVMGEHYGVTYIVADGTNLNYSLEFELDEVLEHILAWVNEIGETLEAPDLWAELRRSRELISSIQQTGSSNTPFTQEEQKQIAAQLQEIKKQAREQFELTNEQIAQLDEKLDEAAEASTRMGRKDWLIYLLGTITALVITATVTGGVGEHIFTMVLHGLAHLFTGGSEPPQIPSGIIA